MMIERHPSELFFLNKWPNGQLLECPSVLQDAAEVDLTVVVPAYNESQRLLPMLQETISYLEERLEVVQAFSYEIILVDDGSSDDTCDVAVSFAEAHNLRDKLRVLKLHHNRGKGGAVCLGVMAARGRRILFADADGATKFSDVSKLEMALATKDLASEDSLAIASGSRAHLEEDSIAHRSFFRTVLMLGFHFFVWLFCVRTVRDTQCGFKLFTRKTAKILFSNLHVERWAFDVELLYMAEKLNIPIFEVPVTWTEMDGSKLIPVFSWLQMGVYLIVISLAHTLGIWRIEKNFV